MAVAGTTPVTFGALTVSGTGPDGEDVMDMFKVSYCTGRTVQPGESCRLHLVGTPSLAGTETYRVTLADDTALGATRFAASLVGRPDATGTYYPQPPHRLWDTRTMGNRSPVTAGHTLEVRSPAWRASRGPARTS